MSAFYLRTDLPAADAFVVAVKSGFDQAGVSLTIQRNEGLPTDADVVRLEMQPDRSTVLVSLPLEPHQEFLEENPDVLEVVVRDALKRFLKRQAR
jgi:hypothetical protein